MHEVFFFFLKCALPTLANRDKDASVRASLNDGFSSGLNSAQSLSDGCPVSWQPAKLQWSDVPHNNARFIASCCCANCLRMTPQKNPMLSHCSRPTNNAETNGILDVNKWPITERVSHIFYFLNWAFGSHICNFFFFKQKDLGWESCLLTQPQSRCAC